MTSDALEAIDARTVLRAYAVLAGLAGLAFAGWGAVWLGTDAGLFPWDQAVLIRLAGAIVMAAALCAWGLASADASAARRGLAWFIGAHGVVCVMLVLQMFGPFSHPAARWMLWVLVSVILALSYGGLSQGIGRIARLAPLRFLENTRGRYEIQIREAAAQEERHRLARDLHDAVKQQIFAIQTAAAAAETRLDTDAPGARDALGQVRQSAREAMSEMEAMLDQLRAVPLENATLVGAVKKAAEAVAFRTGAQVDLHVGTLPQSSAFAPGAHQAIFRVVQEALANVARHARAQHVAVRLAAAGGQLTVTVEDDGVGMDATQRTSGMGLQNMRARAEEAGGAVDVSACAGGGTLITLSVPYETPEVVAARRRKALMLAIVFGNATVLTLLALVTRRPLMPTVFMLLFLAAFTHNVMRYRRLRQRELAS